MQLTEQQYKALAACVDRARSVPSRLSFADDILKDAREGLEQLQCCFGASETDTIRLSPMLKGKV